MESCSGCGLPRDILLDIKCSCQADEQNKILSMLDEIDGYCGIVEISEDILYIKEYIKLN